MWGSYELEDYRQGKQLKLSETIGELKDLSVALAPSVADQRKLAALEPLPSENEELKLKLKTAQDRIASLNATLANVSQPVQTKELAKGASFEPIPNGIMIAVKDIHGYASKCQVSLGGKIEDIVAGSRKGGFDPRSGTDFTIGVVSVSENVCVLKYQRESPAATEEVATGGADD
jgi:FtsZ-binding cell division protein ZapB